MVRVISVHHFTSQDVASVDTSGGGGGVTRGGEEGDEGVRTDLRFGVTKIVLLKRRFPFASKRECSIKDALD